MADALDDMIARVRALGDLATTTAPAVARALDASLRAQIAAGQGPDGQPWKPTQEGTQPLQHAAGALYVTSVGARVVARLDGPEARHNNATAKGGHKRQILPSGALTGANAATVRTALLAAARKAAGT